MSATERATAGVWEHPSWLSELIPKAEMRWVSASTPVTVVPAWAVLERALFSALDEAAQIYERKYSASDGSLRYPEGLADRDGVDDFYEAFYNLPLLYLLGGSDRLLEASHHHWNGITAQLTELGGVVDEYERGYDWYHQGESLLFFYLLCLADPANPILIARARRFADLYVDPARGNFDTSRNLIRAPHNGATGARWGLQDDEPEYPWRASLERYGLPLDDVPGVTTYDSLRDPALARAMGRALDERNGRGDVAVNLLASSLVTLAYLMTGDPSYRRWVLRYVEGWSERAAQNSGRLPDNVGPSGVVGELHEGRWYGGHYGWLWPHGLESVGSAAVVAGCNAHLLSRTTRFLDMARFIVDDLLARGVQARIAETEMSQQQHWADQYGSEGSERPTLLVPHRFGAQGWFDYQPMYLCLPTSIWGATREEADLERLRLLRAASGYDWANYRPFRNKHDAGHEDAWLAYLLGDFPRFPELALQHAFGVVNCRLARINEDDPSKVDLHRWQELNPVTTEVLLQLTTGSLSPIYNGGLPLLRLRYYDADRGRPGLPGEVAALVKEMDGPRVVVELVNTSVASQKRVVLQAGTFGEDRIRSARFGNLAEDSGWPGSRKSYAVPAPALGVRSLEVQASCLGVRLDPCSTITLTLDIERLGSARADVLTNPIEEVAR